MKRYAWILFLIIGVLLFTAGLFLDAEHYDWAFGFSGILCGAIAVLLLLVRLIRAILSRFSVTLPDGERIAVKAGSGFLRVLLILIKAVGYFLAGVFIVPLFPLYLIYLYNRNRKQKEVNLAQSTSQRGQAYEQACAKLLEREGYKNVELTPVTGDFGADILAVHPKGYRVCFQCKYYSSNVGEKAVQEVISAVHYYGASYGIVITNADFTPKARELAKSAGVELWSRVRYC